MLSKLFFRAYGGERAGTAVFAVSVRSTAGVGWPISAASF